MSDETNILARFMAYSVSYQLIKKIEKMIQNGGRGYTISYKEFDDLRNEINGEYESLKRTIERGE